MMWPWYISRKGCIIHFYVYFDGYISAWNLWFLGVPLLVSLLPVLPFSSLLYSTSGSFSLCVSRTFFVRSCDCTHITGVMCTF